jgi:hypothetical protein
LPGSANDASRNSTQPSSRVGPCPLRRRRARASHPSLTARSPR